MHIQAHRGHSPNAGTGCTTDSTTSTHTCDFLPTGITSTRAEDFRRLRNTGTSQPVNVAPAWQHICAGRPTYGVNFRLCKSAELVTLVSLFTTELFKELGNSGDADSPISQLPALQTMLCHVATPEYACSQAQSYVHRHDGLGDTDTNTIIQ